MTKRVARRIPCGHGDRPDVLLVIAVADVEPAAPRAQHDQRAAGRGGLCGGLQMQPEALPGAARAPVAQLAPGRPLAGE
jgi:hypothetical protein